MKLKLKYPIVASTFLALLASVAIVAAANDSSAENPVVRIARSFSDAGGYSVKWTGSGTPEEVRFDGTRILPKCDAGGTYCSGFTFAVAMRVAGEAGLLKGKTVEDVRKFQKAWYGSSPDAATRERQCAVAVEQLGIGKSVDFKDARPGDFAQIWRSNKTGHSVVFLGWAEEDGKPVGLKYRSSQKSTDGVGDRTEYFSDVSGKDGKILRDRVYFARLNFR